MRFEAKLAAWRVVLGWIDDGPGDARRLAPGTD
jgi:hypothetical protein